MVQCVVWLNSEFQAVHAIIRKEHDLNIVDVHGSFTRWMAGKVKDVMI